MKRYLRELFRRKDLLLYLVTSGLKAQHRNTFLGYFWWLLDPLLGVLIYYFMVGIIFHRGGDGYILNLVVGLTVWRWLQTSVKTGSRSITAQAGIITQVYLPKTIFPLGAVLTQLINFSFSLVVVGMFLIYLHRLPGFAVLWLPYIMLTQLLFTTAITLPLSYLSVFVRDMNNVLDHAMRFWFYTSPVIWTESIIPPAWRFVLRLNPMAHFLAAYRSVLIEHTSPDYVALFYLGVVSALGTAVIVYLFSRHEHRIIKAL